MMGVQFGMDGHLSLKWQKRLSGMVFFDQPFCDENVNSWKNDLENVEIYLDIISI